MADQITERPEIDLKKYADQLRRHARGEDKKAKTPGIIKEDGATGTFDTGAYGINRPSTAVSKPSGMPKGRIFGDKDFTA